MVVVNAGVAMMLAKAIPVKSHFTSTRASELAATSRLPEGTTRRLSKISHPDRLVICCPKSARASWQFCYEWKDPKSGDRDAKLHHPDPRPERRDGRASQPHAGHSH